MPAPTYPGFTNVTYTSVYAGTGFSLAQLCNPAPLVNDVFSIQNDTSPGNYPDAGNDDGTGTTNTSGNDARQSFQFYLWRNASNTSEGPQTVWINALPPVWANGIVLRNITTQRVFSTNLAQPYFASSPSGDILTFALAAGSTLPFGLSLAANGMLTGAVTLAGTYTFVINATDAAGLTSASPVNLLVVSAPINPPPPVIVGNGTNMWSADGNYEWTADGFPGWSADGYEPTQLFYAVQDLAMASINVGTLTYQYSANGTPVGWVITGYPYLAESLPAGSYASLVISNGPMPAGTTVKPPSVVGEYYYNAQLQILHNGLRIAPPIFVLDAAISPGRVISQSLPTSVAVPTGTQMTITVSGFPVVLQPATVVPVP